MKKFGEYLRKNTKNIINFEKILTFFYVTINKRRIRLTSKVCYICGKKVLKKLPKSINYQKVRDHCHYPGKYTGAAHSICNFKFDVPNEIPVVFHNDSNYVIILSLKN